MDWQRLFYMAASQASRGDVLESRVRGLEPNLAKVALFLSPQVHDVNSQAYTVIDKSMPMNEKYATQTMTKNLFTVSVRRDFLRKVKGMDQTAVAWGKKNVKPNNPVGDDEAEQFLQEPGVLERVITDALTAYCGKQALSLVLHWQEVKGFPQLRRVLREVQAPEASQPPRSSWRPEPPKMQRMPLGPQPSYMQPGFGGQSLGQSSLAPRPMIRTVPPQGQEQRAPVVPLPTLVQPGFGGRSFAQSWGQRQQYTTNQFTGQVLYPQQAPPASTLQISGPVTTQQLTQFQMTQIQMTHFQMTWQAQMVASGQQLLGQAAPMLAPLAQPLHAQGPLPAYWQPVQAAAPASAWQQVPQPGHWQVAHWQVPPQLLQQQNGTMWQGAPRAMQPQGHVQMPGHMQPPPNYMVPKPSKKARR